MQIDTKCDISLLTKAASFAAQKHSSQRRKGPGSVPYINHPLEVANILAEAGVDDVATLCAAFLHDTIEDTETTKEQLQNQFGQEICDIVLECSDDKNLSKDQRKRKQIEHSKHVSAKARLVKIADKLNNNESLGDSPPEKWSPERVHGYHIWSYAVCKNLFGAN